jgi:hypothetical protein
METWNTPTVLKNRIKFNGNHATRYVIVYRNPRNRMLLNRDRPPGDVFNTPKTWFRKRKYPYIKVNKKQKSDATLIAVVTLIDMTLDVNG